MREEIKVTKTIEVEETVVICDGCGVRFTELTRDYQSEYLAVHWDDPCRHVCRSCIELVIGAPPKPRESEVQKLLNMLAFIKEEQ